MGRGELGQWGRIPRRIRIGVSAVNSDGKYLIGFLTRLLDDAEEIENADGLSFDFAYDFLHVTLNGGRAGSVGAKPGPTSGYVTESK